MTEELDGVWLCNSCATMQVLKVPCVEAVSEADYMGFIVCEQRLSDHHQHLVTVHHRCAWHSQLLKDDERYADVATTCGGL